MERPARLTRREAGAVGRFSRGLSAWTVANQESESIGWVFDLLRRALRLGNWRETRARKGGGK